MILSCVLLSVVLGSIPLTRFMLGPALAFAFFCWVDAYVGLKGPSSFEAPLISAS